MAHLPPNKDDGVCIDQFEQAVEFYQESTQSWIVHPFNYPLDDLESRGISFRSVDSAGMLPQAYISQRQSKTACATSGKRLCKLYEWLAGCQGGSRNYTYPYGNTFKDGACNTGWENPVMRLFGPHPTWNKTEMNDPRLDTLDHTLEHGGAYKECCGPVGTCDQAGNLDEWIDVTTPKGHGVFKGGYFVDDVINGPGCLYTTTAHGATYHDYSLGFRCCL